MDSEKVYCACCGRNNVDKYELVKCPDTPGLNPDCLCNGPASRLCFACEDCRYPRKAVGIHFRCGDCGCITHTIHNGEKRVESGCRLCSVARFASSSVKGEFQPARYAFVNDLRCGFFNRPGNVIAFGGSSAQLHQTLVRIYADFARDIVQGETGPEYRCLPLGEIKLLLASIVILPNKTLKGILVGSKDPVEFIRQLRLFILGRVRVMRVASGGLIDINVAKLIVASAK